MSFSSLGIYLFICEGGLLWWPLAAFDGIQRASKREGKKKEKKKKTIHMTYIYVALLDALCIIHDRYFHELRTLPPT